MLANGPRKIVALMRMRYSCSSAIEPQDIIELPVLAVQRGDSIIAVSEMRRMCTPGRTVSARLMAKMSEMTLLSRLLVVLRK